MTKDLAEGINNKCDGNENWCRLTRKFVDVESAACGYTKVKPKYYET